MVCIQPGNDEHSARTVLVVDDSDDFRLILGFALRDLGYDVKEARNGVEAIEFLRNWPAPALIVLDLRMPLMDGFQFRKIQSMDERLRQIPVILYSNDSDLHQTARCLGVAGAIPKRSSKSEIISEVRRCCACANPRAYDAGSRH